MQLWTIFLKSLNTILPFRDFVYIAQLEEYRPERYYKWMRKFFFRRNIEVREHIVWTPRAMLVCAASIAVWMLATLCVLLFVAGPVKLVAVLALLIGIPIIVGLVNIVSVPFFTVLHTRIHNRAAAKVRTYTRLQVILIAGSFGKTTTKHVLYELIRLHKRTQMTPGTINTTTGIAQWILKNLHTNTEVLIIEADAYAIGDIAQVMRIAPPTISIITALGDQHMERLKTHDVLVRATSEAFTDSSETTVCIAPEAILSELSNAIGARPSSVAEHVVLPNNLTQPPAVQLAMQLAVTAAQALQVPDTFFEKTLTQWQPPERRGVPVTLFGYECLDYSFNVTLTTATAALQHARTEAQKAHKKLLVVTGGITEAQDATKDNTQLGTLCAQYAQHTVVINTMFAKAVIAGLHNAPHSTKEDVIPKLPKSLCEFNSDEWLVLLLPELGDVYR